MNKNRTIFHNKYFHFSIFPALIYRISRPHSPLSSASFPVFTALLCFRKGQMQLFLWAIPTRHLVTFVITCLKCADTPHPLPITLNKTIARYQATFTISDNAEEIYSFMHQTLTQVFFLGLKRLFILSTQEATH